MTYKCRTDQITKCFSSDSSVELKSITGQQEQRKSMNHLQIGDQILVDIDKRGQRIYEPVYSFIHANRNGVYDYLKILIDNNLNRSLIISSNHLVFLFNQTQPCFAGHLKPGDQLQILSEQERFQIGLIKKIELIQSTGFFAPLTPSGKLIVDGVLVSNYAVVRSHRLAHLAMQPYRWWTQWNRSSVYSEKIHVYCRFLYEIIEMINKWIFSIDLYDGYVTVSSFSY